MEKLKDKDRINLCIDIDQYISTYLIIKQNFNNCQILLDKSFCDNFFTLFKKNDNEVIEYIKLNRTLFINYTSKSLQFKGYFQTAPLLIFINNLLVIIKVKKFPFIFFSLNTGLNESTCNEIDNINLHLSNILKEQLDYNDMILAIINSIKERGILTIISLRKTPGSEDLFIPPSKDELLAYFNVVNYDIEDFNEKLNKNKHLKPPILTVGGRALCKHSHRCSNGFWPKANGSDKNKNNCALEMFEKFIHECIWVNIHGLPHNQAIIELRVAEGYGIRWLIGGEFRGFVEPQMIDGHEKGWIH